MRGLGSFADGFIARKIALRYGFYFEPKIVASWVVFPDSVSRRTARELQRSKYILDAVPKPDRGRFRLPVMVRRRVPRPLAVRGVPFGAPGGSDRPGGRPRTGRAFRRREGQIRVDFGPVAPAGGALGDPGLAVVSARPTSLTALLRTMLAMRSLRLALRFRSGRIPGMTTATVAPGET